MVKKPKRRKRQMTIPIALIGGLAGMPNLREAITALFSGNIDLALVNLGAMVSPSGIRANIIPLATGMAVHYGASKLGINRALGAAGVPFIRI